MTFIAGYLFSDQKVSRAYHASLIHAADFDMGVGLRVDRDQKVSRAYRASLIHTADIDTGVGLRVGLRVDRDQKVLVTIRGRPAGKYAV